MNVCRVRGRQFRSFSEAAEYYGVTPQAVHNACERGRMDYVGLGRVKSQPIEIDGVQYPSVSKASRGTGIARSTLFRLIKNNDPRVKV